MTDLLRDERAQSTTYMLAGGTLILFAGFYVVFQQPVADLLAASANNCISEACDTGVTHVSNAWDWLPFIAVGLVAIMIIAASIFKSSRPGA